MTSTYLVIGGAGFIGSRLTSQLCDQGASVLVIDDLSFGHQSLVDPRATFFNAPMTSISTLLPANIQLDAIFLLAARSIISHSYHDPASYIQTNIHDTITVLEFFRHQHTAPIIFSSSASVYGVPKVTPTPETASKEPLTVYGATKSAVEEVMCAYSAAFGMNTVCLRYFNAYGPNDLQQPVTRAVPRWIQAAIKRSPITLNWGGRQTRDYVFVDDIVQAHLACINLRGHHRFNIGSGVGHTMLTIMQSILSHFPYELQILDLGPRVGDPGTLVADTSLIRQVVGWEPSTSLNQGIASTIAFYRATEARWGTTH